MPSTPYVIEGCKSLAGGLRSRVEILDLYKEPKQFSLFIRAVTNIQKLDYKYQGSDAVNWEQLAGIHGSPYQKWSGETQDTTLPPTQERWKGYCHHRNPLFPTWHRVVILLIEQAVWNEAKAIANGIQGTPAVVNDWKQAAETLRFPYWDWTVAVPAGGSVFPGIFQAPEIDILDFNGSTIPVNNPLYSYKFGPIHNQFVDDETTHSYFKSWDRTYRWPTADRVNPTEQYDNLEGSFRNGGPSSDQKSLAWLRDKVAYLFTFPTNLDAKWGGNVWDSFSNVLQGGQEPNKATDVFNFLRTSIEESHDSVHVDIGASGHMGNNDVAAFDPIFWLHHCNVDRIYAFWEYVYPSYWIGNGYTDPATGTPKQFVDVDGTYVEGKDTYIDQSSSLAPFRKSAAAYWTSNDVRGLVPGQGAPKYYTYPPIINGSTKVQVDQPIDLKKQGEYISALQKHWGLELQTNSSRDRLPILDLPFFQRPLLGGLRVPLGYQALGKFRIFVIVISISEHAYGGSFSIELRNRSSPNVLFNKVSFLRRSSPDNCTACLGRQAAHSRVQATMILDSSKIFELVNNAGYIRRGCQDEDMIRLLKTSFEARVVAPDGKIIAQSSDGLCSRTPGIKRLDAGIPTMTFYSASAAHPVGNPGGCIQFCDWATHCTLLGDDWADRR